MSMTARPRVWASTYGEAIEKVGRQMDSLWENGNWKLLSCDATPLRSVADEVLSWEWDMEIEWLGQRVLAHEEEQPDMLADGIGESWLAHEEETTNPHFSTGSEYKGGLMDEVVAHEEET